MNLCSAKKPKINYFRPFGCKCFVLNIGNNELGKFDSKSDEEAFMSYYSTSKAYRVFNKRTLYVKESLHVIFDESGKQRSSSGNKDYDIKNLIPI